MSARKRKATRARKAKAKAKATKAPSVDRWTERRANASAWGGPGQQLTVTLEQHQTEYDKQPGRIIYVRIDPAAESRSSYLAVPSGHLPLLLEALAGACLEAQRTGMIR